MEEGRAGQGWGSAEICFLPNETLAADAPHWKRRVISCIAAQMSSDTSCAEHR